MKGWWKGKWTWVGQIQTNQKSSVTPPAVPDDLHFDSVKRKRTKESGFLIISGIETWFLIGSLLWETFLPSVYIIFYIFFTCWPTHAPSRLAFCCIIWRSWETPDVVWTEGDFHCGICLCPGLISIYSQFIPEEPHSFVSNSTIMSRLGRKLRLRESPSSW